MAALMAEIRVGLNQLFRRASVLAVRSLSTAASSGSGDSTFISPDVTKTTKAKAPPAPAKEEPFDNSTYKVQEYFSYDDHSFYDIEVDIDGTGNRQKQPDITIPYQHTEPWKK